MGVILPFKGLGYFGFAFALLIGQVALQNVFGVLSLTCNIFVCWSVDII